MKMRNFKKSKTKKLKNDKIEKNDKTNAKSAKFTRFVMNLKGFFLKKRKIITKKRNENEVVESDFFKVMKDMMILNIRKDDVIKYFKKDRALRAEIETRTVADYLSSDKKNVFFNTIRKVSKGKLYNLIQNLSLEFYKKDDLIFQYKEPMNKFCIILEGTISLYLPYFLKKFISVKEFLSYFFYIKENVPKSFNRVEKKNEYLFDGIYKLKVNEYNRSCISEDEEMQKQDFFIEEYQNVYNINEGNQVNQISILYNLSQNFNGIALTDVYILSLNRSDFMTILRLVLEEELSKEFIRLRKFCYIFNSWNNYSLAQIMNYYIPSTLINEEFVYKQKDESDSFYIIQEGIFDVYCEISIDEFSKYKRYLLKDNKSVIDWIKEEKENKNKISVEKIIDYIQWKMKIEEYPEKRDIIDKNIFYINKNLLNKDEENDEQLINLKVNEEILKEKNKKFKIKLFTFHKNDFIGLEDSLELKSRFYNVECVSDRGRLNKIRILDFIVFIASNHGLDLQNIINYVKERKSTIIDRIYSNLIRKLDSNKRVINNAISLALSSYEKRNNIFIKSKNENLNEVNFTNKRNNNFTDKIPYLNQTTKRLYTFNQFNGQRKKSASIRKSILLNQLAKNEVKKNNMPKLEWRFNYDIHEKNKAIYQPNISLYLVKNSPDKKNKDRSKGFQFKDNSMNDENNYMKNMSFSKSNKLFQRSIESYKLTQSIYDKLIVRNRNKNSSYNNKIDKEICNMTGIYNTKREVFKKRLVYLSSRELKKHRKMFNNYKLSQSNEVKKRQAKPIFAVLSITDITDGINSIKKNSKKFPITKQYKNLKFHNN